MKLNSGRLWLKAIVFSLIAFLSVWLGLTAMVHWQFNAEQVRQDIESALSDRERSISVQGKISAQAWPRPGVYIEKVFISEANSPDRFASLSDIELGFDWWALLLSGEKVVTHLAARDIEANLYRNDTGRLNIADLLQTASQSDVKIDLDDVELRDMTLHISDANQPYRLRLEQTRFSLNGLHQQAELNVEAIVHEGERALSLQLRGPVVVEGEQLTTSGMTLLLNGEAAGVRGLHFEASGAARFNVASSRLEAQMLHVDLRATEPLLNFTADIPSLTSMAQRLEAPRMMVEGQLNLPGSRYAFDGEIQAVSVGSDDGRARRIEGRLEWRFGQHRLNAAIDTPLHFNAIDDIHLAPLRLSTRLNSPHLPRREMRSALIGEMRVDLKNHLLSGTFDGTLDGEKLRIQGKQQGFSEPKHNLSLSLARLDLNRYLPRAQAQQAKALLDSKQKLGLDWLGPLAVEGDFEIGELSAGRFAMHNVGFHLSAKPDRLALEGLKADIYEGQLSGSFQMENPEQPIIRIDQRLSRMNLHPLLKDVFDFGRLEGFGDGRVQIRAQGKSFDELRKTLNGSLALSLNKGALTGIDLVAALRNLPAELESWSLRPMTPDGSKKTEFQRLNASFRFDNGIARNQDLRFNSSLLNLSGSGKFDLVDNIIDYALEASVNPTAIASVKTLSVPLKITGAIATPTYALDFNRLVKEKKTETEKQEALKEQLTQPLRALGR